MPVAAKELLPPNNKRSPSDLNTTPSLNQLKKPFLGYQENTTTTTTSNSPNSFHRCFSDPCSKPVASQLALQSPLDSSKMVGTNAASLPSQPALRRSVSDPSPNESCSRSSSFKWMKKMRDSMKEINQLWEEIIMPVDEEPPCENHEEDDKGTELENINAIKSDSETDCEESVTVERTGECLIIHFKCFCGEGYQILLYGRNCYYKLM
ncbi:PREDICTED: uncharacterized protein LOC105120903 [Populus euphratica]|uniref:Uncharacterized protein LOC105120903 n=1 Tax=Populus euphratica TaxID=75702 RepID=A0AAJ6TVB3_POPEU|nr:PREDICTED: uncharacterized protein LOC105120903 [Populus euphratica]